MSYINVALAGFFEVQKSCPAFWYEIHPSTSPLYLKAMQFDLLLDDLLVW